LKTFIESVFVDYDTSAELYRESVTKGLRRDAAFWQRHMTALDCQLAAQRFEL
jgi:hypothetical protein